MNNMLQHLSIMITEQCNLDCYHCFRCIAHQKSNLHLDMLSKLSEKIKATYIKSVRVTGGEPLLVKNIDKVISLFSKCDILTSIGTNGILLSSQKINQLKDAGLNEVWISIHSNNADIHDRLSGKPGSFYLTLNAIKECIKSGIKTNVNFPVSAYNIQDALSTLRFLDNLGVARIKLLHITPIGKASLKNNFNHISNVEWSNLAQNVQNLKFQNSDFKMQGCSPDFIMEGKCTIFPLKFINISPSGFIYPCCLFNNCPGMEIGHISELLNQDWAQAMQLFNERIMLKYHLSNKTIPCDSENKDVCPLYSKKIISNNE